VDVGLHFDPRHKFVAAKSAVAANDDFYMCSEAFADGGDDGFERIERAVCAVAVGCAVDWM